MLKNKGIIENLIILLIYFVSPHQLDIEELLEIFICILF